MADDLERLLDRVRALLERGGRLDTPEEEARTSALLGARLIIKHRLVISVAPREEEPAPPPAPAPAPPAPAPKRRTPTQKQEHARTRRGGPAPPGYAGSAYAKARQHAGIGADRPGADRPAWVPDTSRWVDPGSRSRARAAKGSVNGRAPDATRWKDYSVLTSTFDGHCAACGEPYEVGDRVAWRRGGGATHFSCRSFWDEVAARKTRG